MRPTLIVALAALAACDDAGAPPLASGPAPDFGVEPPTVEDETDAVVLWPGQEDRSVEPPDVGQPLVDSGIWTMRVVDDSGAPCLPGVEPGALIDVTVEGAAHSVRLMDRVTLFSEGDGRASGIGMEGGDIAEDCRRSDVMLATAVIHGPERFEARIEFARSYSGDGCAALKDAPQGCSAEWMGRFEWAEPFEGDTGAP